MGVDLSDRGGTRVRGPPSGTSQHAPSLSRRRPNAPSQRTVGRIPGEIAALLLDHGAEFCPSPGRDHLACARLLLEVGAAPDPIEVDACGDEELVELLREHVHDIA